MAESNARFLKKYMDYELVERPKKAWRHNTTIIDQDFIQSGDAILILRLDGLDPFISFGIGSHIGHTAMALRFDGELYVVESQDTWFWPTKNIQRTRFDQWIEWADRADYNVVHLPLSSNYKHKFNETAAIE